MHHMGLGLLLELGRRTAPVRPVPLLVAELSNSRHYCLKGRRPVLKAGQSVKLRRPLHEPDALEAWRSGCRIGRLRPRDASEIIPLIKADRKLECWVAAPAGGQGLPVRIAVALTLP